MNQEIYWHSNPEYVSRGSTNFTNERPAHCMHELIIVVTSHKTNKTPKSGVQNLFMLKNHVQYQADVIISKLKKTREIHDLNFLRQLLGQLPDLKSRGTSSVKEQVSEVRRHVLCGHGHGVEGHDKSVVCRTPRQRRQRPLVQLPRPHSLPPRGRHLGFDVLKPHLWTTNTQKHNYPKCKQHQVNKSNLKCTSNIKREGWERKGPGPCWTVL